MKLQTTLRPLVLKPGYGGVKRPGKGFSLEELKQAGLTSSRAMQLLMSVDKRRRTVHKGNVETIKQILAELTRTQNAEAPKATDAKQVEEKAPELVPPKVKKSPRRKIGRRAKVAQKPPEEAGSG